MTDLGNSTGSTNIGGNENPPRQTRKIISSSLKSATKHHDNTESNGERWGITSPRAVLESAASGKAKQGTMVEETLQDGSGLSSPSFSA
jgi:hypothetical protein